MEDRNIRDLREVMGTNPAQGMERKDDIYVGCKGITVKMIDWPANPYEAIFEGVTATWGDSETWSNKYERTSDEGKLITLLATLGRKTLTEVLEAPKFSFAIEGASRAAFDQYARHRIGVGINSVGTRDNDWMDCSLRIPHEIADDPKQMKMHEEAFRAIKDAYETTIRTSKESWQSGRFILPMGVCHKWVMSANYLALQNMAFQRMKFCEQFDTVGVMWLIRDAISERYPLLAAFMRPGCDYAQDCQYHAKYGMSELFGCLFQGCGRWPTKNRERHAEFNRACSTKGEIAKDLKIQIPNGKEWTRIVTEAILTDPHLEFELSTNEVRKCIEVVQGKF